MLSRVFGAFSLMLSLLGVTWGVEKDESFLTWKPGRMVDAKIEAWSIQKLLGQVAASTGWKIYMEPGLEEEERSVTFKDLHQGEALRLLLGKVNYALHPQNEGPSRLYVYSSSLSRATAVVAPNPANKPTNWLANEIIVTLAPGAKEDMEKLAESLGGKLVASAEELNSFRLQFEDAEAAEKARENLAGRSELETSDNYEFQRPAAPNGGGSSTYGAFGIDPAPVGQGEQITVAVVDTAVQALDGKMKGFLLPGLSVVEPPTDLPETPTHGTSMVQTLLNSMALGDRENITGKVRVLPVDIYGGSESTTTFEVARGLQAAIQQNPNVINLSLGGTGYSPIVEQLLEMAYEKQIVVFASAGNTPTTDLTFPAASPYVIGVTAARPDGSIAEYANRGDFVDIKAPGNALVYFNGQTFVSTGTSTATAFASGRAAALTAQGLAAPEVAGTMLNIFDVKAAPRPSPSSSPR